MSASRARRRLMRWERYERRALLLGAVTSFYGPLRSAAHKRTLEAVNRQIDQPEPRWWRSPWMLREPYRPEGTT